LVGFSLGTSIAAALSHRGVRLASVTLLAPTTELDMRPADGKCRDRFETLKYLDKMTSPTLVIHGARDETLPISGGRLIVARLAERARLIEHPDLGHLELPETPAVIDEVRAFVAAH
jgi:pimeloyl-ACP methyl ester carboxylesterase